MSSNLNRRRLDQLLEISRRAGSAILEIYARDFSVVEKADSSPLTQADLAAHHLICAALAELDPDTPVLSEESVDIPFSERRRWQEYWLVDPLDGTREFVKRNGEFTVNIALILNHVPVMGVVHVPVSGKTYFGARELGAFRRDGEKDAVEISCRRPSAKPVIVVGSRSHGNPGLAQRLNAIGTYELISMGSSLKFCLVAEGKADFYPRFGPTSEWDTAAGQAVVEAAGGRVTTLDGWPLLYNRKESLLNPEFLAFGDTGVDWAALVLNS